MPGDHAGDLDDLDWNIAQVAGITAHLCYLNALGDALKERCCSAAARIFFALAWASTYPPIALSTGESFGSMNRYWLSVRVGSTISRSCCSNRTRPPPVNIR